MKANAPKHTKALCTICNRVAVITQHKADMGNDIERVFLRCEHCGHEATISYTDPAIRAAMAEQRALNKAGDRAGVQRQAERLQGMMDALHEEMEGGYD